MILIGASENLFCKIQSTLASRRKPSWVGSTVDQLLTDDRVRLLLVLRNLESAERYDYDRFKGRARYYYANGKPLTMSREEYDRRRRDEHPLEYMEHFWIEEVFETNRGTLEVITNIGSMFEVTKTPLPSEATELTLPRAGDTITLYLGYGPLTDEHILGVDIDGDPVYYDPVEDVYRREVSEERDPEQDTGQGIITYEEDPSAHQTGGPTNQITSVFEEAWSMMPAPYREVPEADTDDAGYLEPTREPAQSLEELVGAQWSEATVARYAPGGEVPNLWTWLPKPEHQESMHPYTLHLHKVPPKDKIG